MVSPPKIHIRPSYMTGEKQYRIVQPGKAVAWVHDVPLVVHHHDWWFDNRWQHFAAMQEPGLQKLDALAQALFDRGAGEEAAEMASGVAARSSSIVPLIVGQVDQRQVQSLAAKLAGHAAFQGAAAQRLRMCSDCRVIDLHSAADELRITDP